MAKLAIIYYSATGTGEVIARRAEEAAQKRGAEVRRRHVAETVPDEVIATNGQWQAHRDAVKDEPVATAEDMVWADAVLFGSPTRYGNVASQFKGFIDSLGPQWQQGLLADKPYGVWTSSMTAHGGQESTILTLYNVIAHFGGVIVPPGYTDQLKFLDGNPYGVSHVTGGTNDVPVGDHQLAATDHLVERVLKVADALRA
jgi:NAD(P)H dehydrogenase (quinone)